MKRIYIWLAWGYIFAFPLFSAQKFNLKNDFIEVSFDSSGNLVELKNALTGADYAGGQGLWRIIYSDGDKLEIPVDSESVPARVEKLSDSQLRIEYGGEFPVAVSCRIDGDGAFFTAELKNGSKGKILREFQFPLVKNANIPDDARLIHTMGGGAQEDNLKRHVLGAHTQYIAQDNSGIERCAVYPYERMMNFFLVNSGENSLYFGSYDPNFERTLHLMRYRKSGADYKYLDIGMAKYPFMAPGESYRTAEFEVSPHSGDWRVSARKFRAAADKYWFKAPKISDSIKKMNGWQRMILRHQYGDVFFTYPELDSKINKAGLECGIDTILLFGWWKEGMDAGYPNYSPDDEQGGDEALKQNIKKVQANGGKVLLYFNGQLIDASTDFYKSGLGQKICVKTPSGMPHIERYPFGGRGTSLRVFGNKTFVTACLATEEWEKILKGYVDRAVSLGVDGVFFDQLGSETTPSACFDPSHGHKVPCTDAMKYKSRLLKKMRDYIRSKNPNMSFGIENVGDATSMNVDYMHGCWISYNIIGREKNGKPRLKNLPIFRYTFPEMKVSDRTIRDDSDIERRVNLCLMWGWLSDIEIYRCRATIDETPRYKAYMAAANKLRDKYRSLILDGKYRDRDLAEISDDRLDYTTFENDSQIAVFVSNSWMDKPCPASVKVRGADFVSAEGLGNFTARGDGDSAEVSLGKYGLALLIFNKK